MSRYFCFLIILLVALLFSGCDNRQQLNDEVKVAWGENDYVKVASLYKNLCDDGDANGCMQLGAMYDLGTYIPQNKEKAIDMFISGCDVGGADECSQAGLSIVQLENINFAMKLFKKGCSTEVSDSQKVCCDYYNQLNTLLGVIAQNPDAVYILQSCQIARSNSIAYDKIKQSNDDYLNQLKKQVSNVQYVYVKNQINHNLQMQARYLNYKYSRDLSGACLLTQIYEMDLQQLQQSIQALNDPTNK